MVTAHSRFLARNRRRFLSLRLFCNLRSQSFFASLRVVLVFPPFSLNRRQGARRVQLLAVDMCRRVGVEAGAVVEKSLCTEKVDVFCNFPFAPSFSSSVRRRLAAMMDARAPRSSPSAATASSSSPAPQAAATAAASWSESDVDVALCCGSDLLASMAMPGIWDQKVRGSRLLHCSSMSDLNQQRPCNLRPLKPPPPPPLLSSLASPTSCCMNCSQNFTSSSSLASAGEHFPF